MNPAFVGADARPDSDSGITRRGAGHPEAADRCTSNHAAPLTVHQATGSPDRWWASQTLNSVLVNIMMTPVNSRRHSTLTALIGTAAGH